MSLSPVLNLGHVENCFKPLFEGGQPIWEEFLLQPSKSWGSVEVASFLPSFWFWAFKPICRAYLLGHWWQLCNTEPQRFKIPKDNSGGLKPPLPPQPTPKCRTKFGSGRATVLEKDGPVTSFSNSLLQLQFFCLFLFFFVFFCCYWKAIWTLEGPDLG